MRMYRTLLLAAGLACLAACSWENEEDLSITGSQCDTTNIAFSADIVPLLSTNCYQCHSNVNAPDFGSGLAFEDYGDVSASARSILGAIRHEDGYPPMPKIGAMLDSCQIMTFEAWYNAGTPDN